MGQRDKRVIVPDRNKADLDEVPAEVKNDLEFVFVTKMEQVLEAALEEMPKPKPAAAAGDEVEASRSRYVLWLRSTKMARMKRKGKTTTFSVSVSASTRARLQKAAKRAYGGNVSALIEAIALEADRRDALDWLLARAPAIDDDAFEAFMAEMSATKKKRVA